MTAQTKQLSVVVLYNHVGEDEYEQIKKIDPQSLDFEPEYNIHVATVNEEYSAIADALKKEGYAVKTVNLRENIGTLHSLLRTNPPDVIFNLVEFFRDSHFLESSVAGLYELHNVAYTGCPPFTLSLCVRKGFTKQILLANGIPTPKFRILEKPEIPKHHGLRYPLIVKPAREDASAGIDKESVVHSYPSLIKRLKKMFKEHAPPIMAEEYIDGRELHVSILGNDPPKMLPPVEFDFSKLPKGYPKIITYDAKWNPLHEAFHGIHTLCPAKLTKAQLKKVEQISIAAYNILGCRDYARLDLRLGKHNQVCVLEINPNPDLTEGVSFMDSAEKAGMTFSQTLSRIVRFAYERKLEEERKKDSQKEFEKEQSLLQGRS